MRTRYQRMEQYTYRELLIILRSKGRRGRWKQQATNWLTHYATLKEMNES